MTLNPRPKTDDITETEQAVAAYHTQLSALLTYFGHNIRELSGRKLFGHHGTIYWPHFAAAMRRSTVWRDRFCPRALLERDRKQRGIPPRGAAHTTWFSKALRRHVEGLLAPLIIPTSSTVGGDCVTYAFELRGVGEDRIDDVNPDQWAALNDPKNYTFFKRIKTSDKPFARVLALPPPFEVFKPHQSAVPQEIVAVYYAWRTLTERHQTPFDPRTVGVEWTDTGHLFVNWTRFLNSPFRPPVGITAAECAAFLQGGHSKGKYRLKLAAFPSPHLNEKLPAETCAIDDDDFRAMAEPCSLIDPLYLVKRDNLFDALHHRKRRKNQEASIVKKMESIAARRLATKLTGVQPPSKRERKQAKVHSFCLRPSQHMPKAYQTFERLPWFEQHDEEDVYAISFKGQLYFAQPERLGDAVVSAPTELDAWKRAMDRLSCVSQFTESGLVLNIANKSKTAQMAALQKKEWEAAAPHIIENFISLDDLSSTQLNRVKKATRQRHGEDTANAASGEYWYHGKMLSLAHRTLPLSSVRRLGYCVIPGRNNNEPKDHVFYSAHALKQFIQESKGVVVPVSPDVATPDSVEPAPYVYAWATFCLDAYRKGASYAAREVGKNKHWSPLEDRVLIHHYRTWPRPTREVRAALMQKLPDHSWVSIVARVRHVNELLMLMLTKAQMRSHTVGKLFTATKMTLADYERAAMRLTLLVGIGMNRRFNREDVLQRIPAVANVFKLNDATLKALVLPNTYRSDQFETLAQG